ncbi:hypothetical protein [Paraburkholderia acidisoli]|uniref:Uncharacterized protein n=1 Tax=Paraburkholderia acidisoli TaxID=2571748 RepID=A0A7Z2GF12_9BURK|nr:hypothetical protein [Paraburkholderia acidisoli]QGZ60571.1 hypothetical protein FAZ98_01825 [Paraburkholderia acidisoli]
MSLFLRNVSLAAALPSRRATGRRSAISRWRGNGVTRGAHGPWVQSIRQPGVAKLQRTLPERERRISIALSHRSNPIDRIPTTKPSGDTTTTPAK